MNQRRNCSHYVYGEKEQKQRGARRRYQAGNKKIRSFSAGKGGYISMNLHGFLHGARSFFPRDVAATVPGILPTARR